MQPKERMLALRIMQKAAQQPAYANRIGLQCGMKKAPAISPKTPAGQ